MHLFAMLSHSHSIYNNDDYYCCILLHSIFHFVHISHSFACSPSLTPQLTPFMYLLLFQLAVFFLTSAFTCTRKLCSCKWIYSQANWMNKWNVLSLVFCLKVDLPKKSSSNQQLVTPINFWDSKKKSVRKKAKNTHSYEINQSEFFERSLCEILYTSYVNVLALTRNVTANLTRQVITKTLKKTALNNS